MLDAGLGADSVLLDVEEMEEVKMENLKDNIEEKFAHNGLECIVVGYKAMGHRCGYVGIPKTHGLYGLSMGADNLIDLDVHGGITYAENVILGENTPDIWWLGFDCSHYNDAPDYALMDDGPQKAFRMKVDKECPIPGRTVRTKEYVHQELVNLANQLASKEANDE